MYKGVKREKTQNYSLVLYSGGQKKANASLHRELARMARQKTDGPIRFTYLPFCSDGSETYFMRSVRRYSRYGIGEFCCLAADTKPSASQIRQALNTHIVYLAGGNTFYFLKALKKSGLMGFLRDFADKGGILAGLSAGAHILTPHIRLAGAHGLDPDENDVGLRDLKALGLAPFEILPHYEPKKHRVSAVRRYTASTSLPVFACPDGTGIVVDQGHTRVIGKGVELYFGGVEF
jgi:dipeptidase E